MMANKCGNCRHWRPSGQRHDPVFGQCRLRSYGTAVDSSGNSREIWMAVFRDASCREHEPEGIDKPDS